MYKDLEFVCGGNMGRSPIEAAVARRELKRRGYNVNVNSSGTSVDFMKTATDEQVQKAIARYIPTMIKAGIITSEQERELIEGRNVKAIVAPILNSLSANETKRVLKILSKKNLLGYADKRLGHPEQTIARPYAEIILVNGERNLQRVQAIYAPTKYWPQIDNLGEFEDPFFATFEQHMQIADEMEKATIKAIERYYK